MKTEIKIINENKQLTNTQLKSILKASSDQITIDVINKELSHNSVEQIKKIKSSAANFTDFINRLNKSMAKTNVYKGVEIIYHDTNFVSLLFKRKNFFNTFVYEDISASFTLNNVIKDFDTAEAQLGFKPQFYKPNNNLNYIRTGFMFSAPLTDFNSNWALTLFNQNKLFFSTEQLKSVNSLKGLQLSYDNKHLAFYGKETLDKKLDHAPFKWVMRYKDKKLFNFLSADLKGSIDINGRIDYLGRISKEATWPFVYLKNGFFVKNRTEAVISSRAIDLDADKNCYHFNMEKQSSKLFVNNTLRIGTINSIGKRYYSIFSYANFLAYHKDSNYVPNLNAGIGARLFVTNNLVLEGLVNLDKRKDQKRALCRIIYGD